MMYLGEKFAWGEGYKEVTGNCEVYFRLCSELHLEKSRKHTKTTKKQQINDCTKNEVFC